MPVKKKISEPEPGLANIRFTNVREVGLSSLSAYVKNPRKGNVRAIAESLFEHGQYRPIVLWTEENGKPKKQPEILAGNHTWKGAKFLDDVAQGRIDKPQWLAAAEKRLKKKVRPWPVISVAEVNATAEEAAKIVLVDNRTNDLGGYDPEGLRDLLASLPNPFGTGFSEEEFDLVTKATKQATDQALETLINADAEAEGTNTSLSDILDITANLAPSAAQFGDSAQQTAKPDFGEDPNAEQTPEEVDKFETSLEYIQGILMLRDGLMFDSDNYWGIPRLRSDMLMTELPQPMDTWGGRDATPDDGVTHWLWNYGATSATGLPMDRATLCFFTYDTKFVGWFTEPSFYTAKAINAGIKTAVVPDFSFYDDMTRVEMLYSVYQAQYLGRYFQEAGIRVAPRIQFSSVDMETHNFNLLGIPKGAPVVMTSKQNIQDEAHEKFNAEILTKQVQQLECGTIVVYGGNPARRVAEMLKVGDTKVVWLMNVAGKRREVVYGKKEGLQGMKDKKGLKKLKRDRDRKQDEDAPMEEAAES